MKMVIFLLTVLEVWKMMRINPHHLSIERKGIQMFTFIFFMDLISFLCIMKFTHEKRRLGSISNFSFIALTILTGCIAFGLDLNIHKSISITERQSVKMVILLTAGILGCVCCFCIDFFDNIYQRWTTLFKQNLKLPEGSIPGVLTDNGFIVNEKIPFEEVKHATYFYDIRMNVFYQQEEGHYIYASKPEIDHIRTHILQNRYELIQILVRLWFMITLVLIDIASLVYLVCYL